MVPLLVVVISQVTVMVVASLVLLAVDHVVLLRVLPRFDRERILAALQFALVRARPSRATARAQWTCRARDGRMTP